MTVLRPDDPLAVATVAAIRTGDLPALTGLLAGHAGLATSRIGPERTLLHIATDWPGNYLGSAATLAALVAAGAAVDARFVGAHAETALHWAASNDDVASVDALLDLGADIEADGGVIGNGTPLADAVAFGQWRAARRLVERGARANLWQAAALGLDLRQLLDGATADELTNALWCACHGGQRATAELLLDHGADPGWVGHDGLTPVDAARRSGADDLVAWLTAR